MPNTPMVNAGTKYVNGLQLSRTSDSLLAIAAGAARDSSNVNDIVVAAALEINGATVGANGVDVAALTTSSHYAVFVIDDSTGFNAAAGLLSLLSTPSLPGGYDIYRRIGWVRTDGTSDLLEFRQQGESTDRWMYWDVAIATDITAGSSATFAAVDMSNGVPDLTVSGIVDMLTVFTPTAGNDTCELRPGGSSAAAGYARASGAVAAVIELTNLVCPFDVTTGVDYIVTGSAVALSVAGYMDKLV
jgi:hypothetical protein